MSRGATLLELLVAAALAAGVVAVAGTLYVAVLRTEQATRELLGSTPEAAVLDLLQDLVSCGGPAGPDLRRAEGFVWWRQAVCVRAYVLDVREMKGSGGGAYVLRLRSAADAAALRALRVLAEDASIDASIGPGGWVEVQTANGCACRADFAAGVRDMDPAELAVTQCGGCVPAPGPAEGRPRAPDVLGFRAEVVVVPPGGRLPAGAPGVVSPQGLSVVFLAILAARGGVPPDEPFPRNVEWLPVFVHLPSPTLEAAVSFEAWGSPYLTAGDLGGPGLLSADLDGDGDGELEPGEAPARRLVPLSAVEGWVLWTTGWGRLRRVVPVRCGPMTIPVGDTRECRSNVFRPF